MTTRRTVLKGALAGAAIGGGAAAIYDQVKRR